jgi:hypothetical protein
VDDGRFPYYDGTMPVHPQVTTYRARSARRPKRSRRKRGLARLFILVLIVALIAGAAIAAAARGSHRTSGRKGAASHRAAVEHPAATHAAVASGVLSADTVDERLRGALAPVLEHRMGHLAVGVIDDSTGLEAVYDGSERFHTASIVKTDILATLLLQHQQAATALGEEERELATQMIENSDNDAATDLWDDVGAADGVAEANVKLGLFHTAPGQDGYWGLTSTTVIDQLRLLSDLTSARSPLSAGSRTYELGLMREVEADQRWGVTAAATQGTVSAVKNGWLPDPQLWVINSIGVIHHAGQVLLVAVLSNDQPSEAGGIAQDQAAAVAAADAVSTTRA